MAVVHCIVFAWRHEGRHEALFLEQSPNHRVHFLRLTRSWRVGWGSDGRWQLHVVQNSLQLELLDFRCCKGAHYRHIVCYVDETRPRWMIDGTGRSIKYLGALQLRLDIPRALARTDDDEEWLVLDG